MSDTDMSYQEFWEWYNGVDWNQTDIIPTLAAWREAMRRCEAQMEERERKAFEAGFDFADQRCVTTQTERLETAYRAFKKKPKTWDDVNDV